MNTEITVIVDKEKETFTMDAKQTVLEAILEKDIDVPYSCQGGVCTSCIAKVTEGSATMETNNILEVDEVEEGLVLTCQARPTTEKITLNFDEA